MCKIDLTYKRVYNNYSEKDEKNYFINFDINIINRL